MVEFFNKLTNLWNEPENYVKIPMCTCEATEKITKMMEEDKVHQFLMGLDDESYFKICIQILALALLHSLDRIFTMVQQEEKT